MKFFIDSEEHAADHRLSGLLGFTMAQSYEILSDNQLKIKDQILQEWHAKFTSKQNYEIMPKKYEKDHVEDCLRIDSSDLRQLASHQKHEKYLLEKPIRLVFDNLVPK